MGLLKIVEDFLRGRNTTVTPLLRTKAVKAGAQQLLIKLLNKEATELAECHKTKESNRTRIVSDSLLNTIRAYFN